MFNRTQYKRIAAKILFIFVMAAIFLFGFTALSVFAKESTFGLEYGEELILGTQDIRVTVFKIIRVFLGLLGIIFLAIIIYGGWLWMSSGGEPERLNNAKRTLRNAAIGLFIVLASVSIVQYILNQLLNATGYGIEQPTQPTGEEYITGGLGNGIIDSHYPARDQQDVPRNTKIVITFKEEIAIKSFAANYDDKGTPDNISDDTIGTYSISDNKVTGNYATYDTSTNSFVIPDGEYVGIRGGSNGTIKIFERDDPSDILGVQEVRLSWTEDLKTYVFWPVDPLGSASEDIWYTVSLSTDIEKANGDLAFVGIVGDVGYEWSFETSTLLDLTPPRISSVFPIENSSEPRNVIIKINFDEAVDPTVTSGQALIKNGDNTGENLDDTSFDNITVMYDSNNDNIADTYVAGTFKISNQYKTVEFISQDACGINSCGETIYCLPGNSAFTVKIFAATLDLSAPNDNGFYAITPPDGVVDMANNSFDGNGNGTSQGTEDDDDEEYEVTRGNDHYDWNFTTTDDIDLTAPKIEETIPPYGAQGVSLTAPVETLFSKLMQSSTLNSTNMLLPIPQGSSWSGNYWIWSSDDYTNEKTRAYWEHDRFPDPEAEPDDTATKFEPEVTDGVRDVYQNCFQGQGPGNVAMTATVKKISLSDGGVLDSWNVNFFKREAASETLYAYNSSSSYISNHSEVDGNGNSDNDIAGITSTNGSYDNTARFFLYQNTATAGRLSLGFVLGDEGGSSNGRLKMIIEAPQGSYVAVSDDVDSESGLPEFRQTGSTASGNLEFTGDFSYGNNSDGGMLDLPSGLSSWEIIIKPESWSGMSDGLYFLSADSDGREIYQRNKFASGGSDDAEYELQIIYPAE